MFSCLYEGRVTHERRLPIHHRFGFRLFMLGLDLGELGEVFRGRWLWSARRPSLAWFRRADHFGDPGVSLETCVRDLVEERTGRRPTGRIMVITHPRYFGFVINPISIFFCTDAEGDRIEAMVLEVTNTPWGERRLYVIDAANSSGEEGSGTHQFAKEMHVSPFMGMEYSYALNVRNQPGSLDVRLENRGAEGTPFVATLGLRKRKLTGLNLARVLLLYPFMTLQVLIVIYFQALKLAWKGAPFHSHPSRLRHEKEVHSS